MYDILQLNDMLLPELLEVAGQLKLTNVKKLNKQALIYKILDGQAVIESEKKDESAITIGNVKTSIKMLIVGNKCGKQCKKYILYKKV
jgi:transcription termination factor Rho